MTPALAVTLLLAGIAYLAAIVVVVGLFIAVFRDRCDRFADRAFGPVSSATDPTLQLGLLAVMDEDPTPCGRRHA